MKRAPIGGSNDVLLVVDIQNDFCAGGALAVPDADAIVPLVNAAAGSFAHVVLTQDWHPRRHTSFASTHSGRLPFDGVDMSYGFQILWPDHCVQGTAGAAFRDGLDIPHAELVVRKGHRPSVDSYSAFFENDQRTPTGLAGYLKERVLTRVFICGLALDFCVAFSAIDGRRLGFDVTVIADACRAIDTGGSLLRAYEDMRRAGVQMITMAELPATARALA